LLLVIAALSVVAACDGLQGLDLELDTELKQDQELSDAPDPNDDLDSSELDTLEELAELDEDLEPTTLRARYEPEGEGFYATPWPDDRRRYPDGRIDLRGYGGAGTLVESYMDVAETLTGFANMPVISVQLLGSTNALTLPTAAESLSSDSPVQLFAVDDCEALIPLRLRLNRHGDRYRPAQLLSATPMPGFVLRPNTRYGYVLTKALVNPSDGELLADQAFLDSLSNDTHFAPLRACLSQRGIPLDSIRSATVFTTQDPVAELRGLREQVMNPLRTPAPSLRNWAEQADLSTQGETKVYFADYDTPIFQEGASPYDQGGAFVFDEQGQGVVQRWESVPLTVVVPLQHQGIRPVLLWVGGTGASRTGFIRAELSKAALDAGFVIVSFLPQMHPPRAVEGADPVMHSFNALNPWSGRTVFRQQALDTSYLIRLIREALPQQAGIPPLELDHLVYGGHSQGGIVGAILAGVESEIVAYFLNGTGGYLSATSVERTDPLDLPALLAAFSGVAKSNIEVEHPVVQLAQLCGEVVDPSNYSYSWRGDALRSGVHVFLSNGMHDSTTPVRSVNAITIAAKAVPLAGFGWDVDPDGIWDIEAQSGPISGNTLSAQGQPLTIATMLSETTGHFTVQDRAEVREAAVRFWTQALKGVPSVQVQLVP
jgi:predicted esterase